MRLNNKQHVIYLNEVLYFFHNKALKQGRPRAYAGVLTLIPKEKMKNKKACFKKYFPSVNGKYFLKNTVFVPKISVVLTFINNKCCSEILHIVVVDRNTVNKLWILNVLWLQICFKSFKETIYNQITKRTVVVADCLKRIR